MVEKTTNFLRIIQLSYKSVFPEMQGRGYINTIIISPVLFAFMLALAGKYLARPEVAETYFVGMASYVLAQTVVQWIFNSVPIDRYYGTLSILFASPANRILLYLSRAGIHWLNGIVIFAVNLFYLWLLLGLDLSRLNWLTASLSVVLMAISAAAFGLFIGNFAILTKDSMFGQIFASGLLLLLTGAVIPVEALPASLAQFSRLVPVTHGLAAFREAVTGAGASSVADLLAGELAVALGYGLAGYLIFRLAEMYATRLGSLEQQIE